MCNRASFKNALGHFKTSSGKFLFWHTNFTYRIESPDNWYYPLSISFALRLKICCFTNQEPSFFDRCFKNIHTVSIRSVVPIIYSCSIKSLVCKINFNELLPAYLLRMCRLNLLSISKFSDFCGISKLNLIPNTHCYRTEDKERFKKDICIHSS